MSKNYALKGWMIWFALTGFFILMGLSMAVFQGSVTIDRAEIGTGHISTVFGQHLSTSQKAPRKSSGEQNEAPGQISETMFHLVIDHEAEKNSNAHHRELKPSFRVKRVDDHSLGISIENAHPNDVYTLEYSVENRGSLPVTFNVSAGKVPDYLKISNSFDNKIIEPGTASGNYNSIKGLLEIAIGDNAPENSDAQIEVSLRFEQWNPN